MQMFYNMTGKEVPLWRECDRSKTDASPFATLPPQPFLAPEHLSQNEYRYVLVENDKISELLSDDDTDVNVVLVKNGGRVFVNGTYAYYQWTVNNAKFVNDWNARCTYDQGRLLIDGKEKAIADGGFIVENEDGVLIVLAKNKFYEQMMIQVIGDNIAINFNNVFIFSGKSEGK